MAWPIIAAAAQQASGQIQSAITSAFGANQESKAAAGARNYDWWKMLWQRAWQKHDWQSQVEEDWKRWNADNAYNDPKQVALRYANAGINPAMAMSNGSLASASSNSSPAGSPAPYGGTIQPTDHSASINQLGSGLRQATGDFVATLNALNEGDLYKSMIRKNDSESSYNEDSKDYRLRLLKDDAWVSHFNREGRVMSQFLQNDVLKAQYAEFQERIANYRSERFLNNLRGALSIKQDSREDYRMQMEWQELMAKCTLMGSQTSLNYAQAKYWANASAHEYLRAIGQNQQNQNFWNMQNLIADELLQRISTEKAQEGMFNSQAKMMGTVSPILGTAGAMIGFGSMFSPWFKGTKVMKGARKLIGLSPKKIGF